LSRLRFYGQSAAREQAAKVLLLSLSRRSPQGAEFRGIRGDPHTGSGTHYRPIFEITGWAKRPSDLAK